MTILLEGIAPSDGLETDDFTVPETAPAAPEEVGAGGSEEVDEDTSVEVGLKPLEPLPDVAVAAELLLEILPPEEGAEAKLLLLLDELIDEPTMEEKVKGDADPDEVSDEESELNGVEDESPCEDGVIDGEQDGTVL